MWSELALFAPALLVAWALTAFVLRHAAWFGRLDVPNNRSSHRVAVSRAGGLAIAATVLGAAPWLYFQGLLDAPLLAAVLAGGGPIAILGHLDDRHSVPPAVRLVTQVAVALGVLAILGGPPLLQVGTTPIALGSLGYLLGLLAIVWTTNLFNFMDGIDGLAASQAVFMGCAGALLALVLPGPAQAAIGLAMVVAGAAGGFLWWNWPPARLFMGDAGSSFLGFMLALLAFAEARTHPVAIFSWLVLGGVFFVDATLTFVCRAWRREAVLAPHRSHAYQHWASRLGHRGVVRAIWAINVAWLLPMATLCRLFPAEAWLLALLSFLPLTILAARSGAGRVAV